MQNQVCTRFSCNIFLRSNFLRV